MTRYRKKPVEVEAWQVGTEPVPPWIRFAFPWKGDPELWKIRTTDGYQCFVMEGTYLFKEGVKYQKMPPSIFEQSYEPICDDTANGLPMEGRGCMDESRDKPKRDPCFQEANHDLTEKNK